MTLISVKSLSSSGALPLSLESVSETSGHPQRRLSVGAGENHVFHRFAAQLLDALLAHHPADGVDHVALAAAVGADDRGDAGRKLDDWPFRKTT